MKTKLIGSASTIEELERSINKYFYSPVTWLPQGDNVWLLRNTTGPIEGFRVIKKKTRYRFEYISEPEEQDMVDKFLEEHSDLMDDLAKGPKDE